MTLTNRSSNVDICISGGGIPGLTLAQLLAEFGFSITVIDPAPLSSLKETAPGNHTSAIMESNIELLQKIDVWQRCQSFAEDMKTLKIIDDSVKNKTPVEAVFHAYEIDQNRFGMNIPNNVLRAALCEKIKTHNKVTFKNTKLAHFETAENKVNITLENNEIINAMLLVGADGRKSAVREQANIAYKEKDYNQKAITCRVEHSKPHENISTEFHRPSGPFTLVPLSGQTSSIVWVDESRAADTHMTLDKTSFEQSLQERTNNILGTVKLIDTPNAWPLISIQAGSLIAPRVALIAEAAHVLHPMGAQGLNLSLRDAASLADTIIHHARLGLDYGQKTALESYEQQRRQDIQTRLIGTNGLTQMLCTHSPFLKKLRRTGLQTIANISAVKRTIMEAGFNPDKTA